ncbi:2-oxoglutarate dehydrogenase E1 component [Thioalkalivibrio sp. XN279]|uniref:2-oxoglutarate dehydrogenase E1 component n=1 Tax=Thioalkalivibrio sp. XN279 TaxID=2714953 RepID=UPI001407B6AD|nr:2-oxoglutarate dehydrogenase E1 component [Thioalkalivibrio sp. XN279]NHA14350.1 2-oxoglutarate dehydrogenase E1 component [Thioalkalivibrio sp. XN279]
MSKSLQERYATTPLSGGNAPYVEALYEQYLEDPDSVDPGLRRWFDGIADGGTEIPRGPIEQAFAARALKPRAAASSGVSDQVLDKQAAVLRLIEAYRLRGHRMAKLDPLGLVEPQPLPELDPAFHGLGDADNDTVFATAGFGGAERLKFRDIRARLAQVYTGTIAAELGHITDTEERLWLQRRFEAAAAGGRLEAAERRHVLERLTGAEGIERYLHTRYVGQKRFSLEGGESMIPLLGDVIQQAGARGMEEVVIGMAHRGRLNVLVNVLGKPPKDLFSEFEGAYDPMQRRSGDVKYHLGFSSDISTPGGNIHVALSFNPSHLEIVNPVVTGSVRARQDRRGDPIGATVLPILIHGDAAFAGQGVVMETLQMSQTRGFATGGTLHVICNNQVGFTTSHPQDARSTPYCSDVAKMIEAPIFHVNGDDPDAVGLIGRLAFDYRMKYRKDVVIDLVCYRRHGHNEADEPAATQPTMYSVVRNHPTTRKLYADRLAADGVIKEEEAQQMVDAYRQGLDEGRVVSASVGFVGNKFTVDWTRFDEVNFSQPVRTRITPQQVRDFATAITHVPEGHKLHPRVERIMADRGRMAAGEIPMDWGFAETMAYASLVTEGYDVRITGQDSGRGTFFHRHAVLHDQAGRDPWIPLKHVTDDQKSFTVIDSLLSEEAVLGFEYGYATTNPDTLVIWEAQFGDFVNGAQVVIDQFISSGETKWGRYCGLMLFLPHGYEGQGPEHSSARLERFLQLCAEHNMSVVVPSNPAQMFHLIRRQMVRPFRKPTVVMTPKSLLRHKLSVSPLDTLSEGRFLRIIPEVDDIAPEAVSRLVLCSGKVYYDLLEARREQGIDDVAIVRVEQLYPFPIRRYAALIEEFPALEDVVWCQEEPQNQGAWYQIRHRLQEPLHAKHQLFYAGRKGAAAPAAGYYGLHQQQQQALVETALSGSRTARQKATSNKATRKKA